jgi:hypothetical protein
MAWKSHKAQRCANGERFSDLSTAQQEVVLDEIETIVSGLQANELLRRQADGVDNRSPQLRSTLRLQQSTQSR